MCYLNVRQCFHYPDYGCGTSQKVVDLDDTDFNLMRFGDRITGWHMDMTVLIAEITTSNGPHICG